MITKWALGNNVRHTLFASISSIDVSVTLNLASPPFRSIAAPISKSESSRGVITLADSLTNPTKIEIITFSSWVDNGDGTVTLGGLLRGQESTIASAFGVGDFAFQSLTAEGLDSALLSVDHLERCVVAEGAGDYSVPALRVGSGGIRSVTAGPSDNSTVIECSAPSTGTGNGFFRIVAGVDGVQMFVPPPTDSSFDGPDSGVMDINWYSYPPSFDQSIVAFKNIRAYRIEGIKATRYAVNNLDALASNVTIDWSGHDIRRMPLAGNSAITMSDTSQTYPNDAHYRRLTFLIEIPNIANPGYTVSWSSNVKWANGGGAPSFSTGQNQVREIEFLYDGTNYLAQTMRTYQL